MWSGAIAGGELDAGVGALVGPVGSIVGGLIGGIIGGLRRRDDTARVLVLWWELESFC
jgi:phage tail tape-measure protein